LADFLSSMGFLKARRFDIDSILQPALETVMQVKLLSLAEVARAVKRSLPYVRALADSGAVDSYICSSGWRGFPPHALDQIKAHEKRRATP
jgi:hypothetical protein